MDTIFTEEKLFRAYFDCRKTKKNTANALKFEMKREKNLFKLLDELRNRKYKISRHICFIVKEPSPREIFAADFRDRVVHHLLYNEIFWLFEKDFIENSFANRIDKGTHKGAKKLRDYFRKAGEGTYYLKLDIKSFFCSINKDILYKIVSEKVEASGTFDYWKEEILWLCKKIIYHDPTQNYIFKGNEKLRELIPKEKSLFYSGGNGLPIGNLTSQFFANVYLDQLDQFVYSLGYEYYVRYVDDFIILGDKMIISGLSNIKGFLEDNLNLKISDKKTKFQLVSKGIDFLGYYVKPDYVLVRRRVVTSLKEKLLKDCGIGAPIVRVGPLRGPTLTARGIASVDKCGNMDAESLELILAMINSYYGHFKHAFSFNLRKDIYEKHLGELWKNFEPNDDYFSLKHAK